MRITSLALQGLTRFTDRVELDLSNLPPGLVAVRGANGEGKTTIMEAMGPAALFLELPSRPGNLYDHTNRRDATLELEADHAGHRWRFLIQADSGTTKTPGKVEAYLYRDGEPVNDGKGKTYREAVALYFPRRDVFMASVYAAQSGSGSFHRLDVSERRELFVELLGLGKIKALAKRAGVARAELDAHLITIGERLTELAGKAATAVDLDRALQEGEADLQDAAARAAVDRQELEASIQVEADARAVVDQLEGARRAAVDALARVDARVSRLEAEASALLFKIRADRALVDFPEPIRARASDLVAATLTLATAQASYREANGAHQVAIGKVQDLIADLARVDRDVATLERDLSALDRLAARLPELEATAARLEAHQARRPGLFTAHATAREATAAAMAHHRELEATRPDPDRARAFLEADQRAAGEINAAPCGGRRLDVTFPDDGQEPRDGVIDCGACSYLGRAREALARLPERQADLDRAERDALELGRRWAALQEARAAEDLARVALERADLEARPWEASATELRGLRERLEARGDLSERLAELATRRGDLVAKRQELEATVPALVSAREAAATAGRDARAKVQELEGADAKLRDLEAAGARLVEIEAAHQSRTLEHGGALAERAGIVVPAASTEALAALEAATRNVTEDRARAEATRELEGTARGRLGALQERRGQLGDLVGQVRALEARRDSLARRRAGFRAIETALGERGVQALEIDAAGPTVSALTNELISACYGPRFRVTLRTIQEAEAGRKARETFDLRVLDGARAGGARDLADLSGGEQVLIDEAVKLGIALFNAKRTGSQVATLWRDECDGKLDPENASRYPSMLRRALELGGFRNVFYVSHRPDVAAQADATINVADGRARLVVR
jgi:exonuclease SbcC